MLPDTYKFARGDDAPGAADARWRRRRPRSSTKSGPSARPICRSSRPANWSPSPRSSRRRPARPTSGRASPACSSTGCDKHMKLESDPTIVYGLVFGKGTLGHRSPRPSSSSRRPTTPTSSTACRRDRSAIPARRRSKRSPIPRARKELYFVADGTGGHAFAETLDQHLKNVAHWRADREGRQGPARARRDADADARRRRRPSTARSTMSIRRFSAPSRSAPRRSTPARWRRGSASSPRAAGAPTRCSVPAARCRRRGAAGASLEELGAVVTGVNDAPPTRRLSPTIRRPDGRRPADRLGSAVAGGARRSEGAHRPLRRRRGLRPAPIRVVAGARAPPAGRAPAAAARLRRFRRHAARSAAQQDLRSELRARRAGARQLLRRRPPGDAGRVVRVAPRRRSPARSRRRSRH